MVRGEIYFGGSWVCGLNRHYSRADAINLVAGRNAALIELFERADGRSIKAEFTTVSLALIKAIFCRHMARAAGQF